jgi:hypothetical protein
MYQQPTDDTGTQRAIRFGVNQVLQESNRTKSTSFAAESLQMVSKAQDHMQMFIKSNSTAASVTKLIDDNMSLIKATVQGVIIAYEAISSQLATLKEQRKNFEEELQLNMATFTIPGHLESMDLSTEQQAVAGFFEKMEKFPLLFAYSGVKRIYHEGEHRTQRYCALPLYAMNQLRHPIASPRTLDEARIAINLLFHSKAIQAMQKIADDFRTDSKVMAFFKSTFEGTNYLNTLRAPRIIITMLLNILWNIQHPIDCETGYGLTLSESIRLCAQFKNLLNLYLSDKTNAGPHTINTKINELRQMIFHIELRANKLHIGFIDEKLRRFNLKDLTNSAHRTLRELDTSLFQLIFHKKNHVTNMEYPDKLAAPDIADTISVMNELINKNPIFLSKFNEECKQIPERFLAQTYLNTSVKTIIDVLIVFCHLGTAQRRKLIAYIRKFPNAGEDDCSFLANELSKFNRHYITPIETMTEKLLKNKSDDARALKISKLTASRILPLFTLVAADYRIDVNEKKATIKLDPEEGVQLYHSGKEQVQLINDAAQMHSENPPNIDRDEFAYHWSLSPYLALTNEAAQSIDNLPSKQYRMTQITELLDCISELTQNYKSFLQFKSFQAFLLECLQYVNDEYRLFAEEAQLVEQYLSLDGLLDRTLKDVLLTMIGKLSDNLLTFRQTIDDITHIVGSPDFTELRKHELTKQVKRIETKFTQLFGKNPVNFTNTYQHILSQVDMAPVRQERVEKTKKIYEFAKQFFVETQKALLATKPHLPKAPHFLSELKEDKLPKYLAMVNQSIKHMDALLTDGNFLLDAHELIAQLELINSDQQLRRTEDDIKRSTYCQVVICELKKRFTQPILNAVQPPFVPLLDASILLQNEPVTRVMSTLRASPSPLARNNQRPMLALTSNASIIRPEIDNNRNTLPTTFDLLKYELKKILEDYIASKKQQRPNHWFYHVLQIFKNFFAQFSGFIKARLLETKIQVAQKVVNSLKNSPEGERPRSFTSVTLLPNELTTLSHGSLGRKTLFFRQHAFWQQLTAPAITLQPVTAPAKVPTYSKVTLRNEGATPPSPILSLFSTRRSSDAQRATLRLAQGGPNDLFSEAKNDPVKNTGQLVCI